MTEDLRFQFGISAEAVVGSLEQLIIQGKAIATSGGGIGVAVLQNTYLQWVEAVERALRHLFESTWLWEELYGRRWEQIARLDENTVRPYPLITNEAAAQSGRLQSLVDEVSRSLQLFELPAGAVAVIPDTSVLLHCQFFRDLDWPRLVAAKKVRLVVPLIVVKQLDRQTYRGDANEARRARRILRAFHGLQEDLPTPETPVDIKPRVSLQMLGDPRQHVRKDNEDEELLDRAEYLSGLVSGRLVTVTRDMSMNVQARLRSLKCVYLQEADESS